MMRASHTIPLTLLSCLLATPATADEGFALFPGMTTGIGLLHTGLDTPGWTIGAELSAVFYQETYNILGGTGDVMAIGGYIDALRDLGSESTRISVGPELVWWCFGIDGGYLLQRHDGRAGHGVTGRLFIAVLVPGLYVRGGKTWGDVDDTFMEIGITLKVPLLFEDEKY